MAKIDIKLDSQIQKAIKDTLKAGKAAIYPIAGYKGLEIRIRPHKTSLEAATDFRHRYTHPITGKRPYMTLGQYPALSLADARLQYTENMKLLASGIDPIEHRDNEKQRQLNERDNTLNTFIDEWLEIQKHRGLSLASHASNARLIQPIAERLGNMPVTDIKPSTVITFIKDIQRYSPYKGLRVRSILERILQLPLANMAIEYNPASNLNGIFITPKSKNKPAITDPKQFGELLNDIDQLDDTTQLYNKRLLKLLALTFVRVGDLCAMKWGDIDLNAKQWAFEQQKGANRDDMQASLVVPLAPQAIAILDAMKALTGDNEYVFYNGRRKLASYHNPRELNKVLNSDFMNNGESYLGIHCLHGFRAAAKTMLTERLGFDEMYTELQLGHAMLNKYGRAYNRMQGLDKRAGMMTAWANYLDQLRAGKIDNIIYPDFKPTEKVKQG